MNGVSSLVDRKDFVKKLILDYMLPKWVSPQSSAPVGLNLLRIVVITCFVKIEIVQFSL